MCVYSSQNYTKRFVAFLCNFLHCLIEADLYCVLCVAVLVATRIYILQIKMTNSPISPLHPSHYNIFLTNLRTLKTCGDSLFHGGCNQIAVTLHTHLNCIRFDRTIFNFPHAASVRLIQVLQTKKCSSVVCFSNKPRLVSRQLKTSGYA